MRLIDADALMREYQERICLGVYCADCTMTDKVDGTCLIERWIYAQPTIDAVELKHGHWEYTQIKGAPMFSKDRWYCSVCSVWQTYGGTNYCPNCGAKMDEVTEWRAR